MKSQLLNVAALLGLLGVAACSAEKRDFGTGGGGGGGGGGVGGTGGMGTGEGPQLVSSIPANGDMQAAIDGYFLLYFDRPVAFSDAAGKISVTSDGHPEPAFVQIFPCPDNDVTCVAAVYPDTFFGPLDNKLPSATKHTVTIDKSFPDPDGKTNNVDTVVEYTTFPYDSSFFDHSLQIDEESGGIDYDAAANSLFVCGLSTSDPFGFVVDKIRLDTSGPTYVSRFTTSFQLCYGVDVDAGRLYVSATYGSEELIFSNTLTDPLPQPTQLSMTGLPAPNDVLTEVRSTAFHNGDLYLVSGRFLTSTGMTGVLQYNAAGVWSVWLEASTLGYDSDEGAAIAKGIGPGDTTPYLYIASEQTGMVYKVRIADRQVVNQHAVGDSAYGVLLRTDSKGRLYVGSYDGITVYDTAGSAGFAEIARRGGLPAERFGIREAGNDVHIYFVTYRYEARIGTTSITFSN